MDGGVERKGTAEEISQGLQTASEPGSSCNPGSSPGRALCPAGVRYAGGENAIRALVPNVGTGVLR